MVFKNIKSSSMSYFCVANRNNNADFLDKPLPLLSQIRTNEHEFASCEHRKQQKCESNHPCDGTIG